MDFIEYIENLENSTKSIEYMLKNITQSESEYKESNDRWSILEIVGHLVDIETKDFKVEFEIIYNSQEIPWPNFDIEELRIKGKYNSKNYIKQKDTFLLKRNNSLEWLRSITNPNLDKEHYQKIFHKEKMRAGDVLASWVAHDLFHIRQLALAKWYILRKEIAPYSSQYSGFEI